MSRLHRIAIANRGPRLLVAALISPLLLSCTSYLFIQPVDVPDDSLRLVQVVSLATRDEILANRTEIYEPLLASGIADSDIVDGSLGAGITFCCGEHYGKATRNFFFIPESMQIGIGDIVEIKSGRLRTRESPGLVNRATQIRQKADDTAGSCRWDPPEQDLNKVLYCDWMPGDGWTRADGVWIKRT